MDLTTHIAQSMGDARPEVGAFVQVRHRRWLVEAVEPGYALDESTLVTLSCIDDDAIGSSLAVLWEVEPNAQVVAASGWQQIGAAEFDPADRFGAFYRTMRWGCVTATDPTLFQAPFRAGISLLGYQLEPLRKALLMPRVNQFIAVAKTSREQRNNLLDRGLVVDTMERAGAGFFSDP